jgi:hypothetical protein
MGGHIISLGEQRPGEEFVMIPFDYYQLPREERTSIIPICVKRTDRTGEVIAWRWFTDGVAPVADRLRWLARSILDDVWRVSELTEASVHMLWYKHRADLGLWPSRLLYKHAKWMAKDMRAGGARARRGSQVVLNELAGAIREQRDFAADLERHQILDALRQELLTRGQHDITEMMDMVLYGCKWTQVVRHFGESPTPRSVNNIQRRFWRTIAKVGCSIMKTGPEHP